MLVINEGIVKRPLRIVIDGVEGVGKSTFASQFPNPIFIDLENGTDTMNVRRTQKPKTWEEMRKIVQEVGVDPTICRTLVIDTMDRAESLCIKHICQKHKMQGLESFGYGKGYVFLKEEFENLLRDLNKVVEAGINVVVCAHVQIRKFELPDESGSFDRYELKLTKNVAPLVREWCDMQLFVNFKTYVVATDGKNHKASGGKKRVVYTSHSATWDAKNRHGLPDEMDLEFKSIEHLFNDTVQTPPAARPPLTKLRAMMKEAGVTEEEIRKLVSDKGHYPADIPLESYTDKFINGWLIKHWEKIVPLIAENRNY